ncbi:tumor necrosis factor ligand superfamily member 15 [Morone saxatilis]|uniref:tumor necrosis factor ligand superfamily member 15 n=1 Tax=Morone saxatilis TaxID=34816 RepID=UPI0015E23813|nr:tumor necrosis factor ligand superfamily member 15 [Morone saxatilis]
MGQKLRGHTLPAEAACRDSMIDIGRDESVLILIKHCQDMKQQETRLRLITLILLLTCMALLIYTTSSGLRQHEESGSRGQGSAVEQRAPYSRQETLFPEDKQTRLRIHLRPPSPTNKTKMSDGQYFEWDVDFGKYYNEKTRAIVIPASGIYFVYVRITLSCHGEETQNLQLFSLRLRCWNERYTKQRQLTDAKDDVECTQDRSKSVFVGQLFDLNEGDHLSVWIEKGYKLIKTSSFGAFLV